MSAAGKTAASPATADVSCDSGTCRVVCAGDWKLGETPDVPQFPHTSHGNKITYDVSRVTSWDSSLAVFLLTLAGEARDTGAIIDTDALPKDLQHLLALALAVPEKETGRDDLPKKSFVTRTGESVLDFLDTTKAAITFFGQLMISSVCLFRGRIPFRMREFYLLIQETGVGALTIVGLVATLTGLILAFVGSVQLKQFGAEVYVADLVGISMAREMGSLMTAIIMAGRSGAAFAAHIGSMKANEEIDALTTLGIEPHGHLVLPRVIALTLMMPLLSLYATFLGIIGGGVISNATLGISWSQYIVEMQTVVNITEISIGVGKAFVFAVLVAVSGCFSGMRSGTDAAAVGRATTDAVVNSIVLIVVADSIFAVVFSILGI